MYLVKVKLKISKKEKKRLDESILSKFSVHDVTVDLDNEDKIYITYITREPDYSSYSSAISLVNERFVKTIFVSIFGDNILNPERNKIDSISVEKIKKSMEEMTVSPVGDHSGMFNIKYGKLTFSKIMLIKDVH